MENRSRRRGWPISRATRDTVLFLGGIVGMANEVLYHHDHPQPQFLAIYVGFLASIPLLRIRDLLEDGAPGRRGRS
jgi:hypothetical protein